MDAIPVDMKMGFFFDAIFLINGKCVMSAEAILKAGASNKSSNSTALSSNGLEKQIICFSFAYSKILFHSSSVNESNFLNTSYCVSPSIPSFQYFGAVLVVSFDAVYV